MKKSKNEHATHIYTYSTCTPRRFNVRHFEPSFINRRDLMCALQAHIHKIKCVITTFIRNEKWSCVCIERINTLNTFSGAHFFSMHHLLTKKFDGFLMFFIFFARLFIVLLPSHKNTLPPVTFN